MTDKDSKTARTVDCITFKLKLNINKEMAPECEKTLHTLDASIRVQCEPMQNLAVKKEMDKNAGQEGSKVHVNRTVSKNPFEVPLEPETTRELQGQAGTAPEMAPECEKPLHTPDTSTRVEYEPMQNLVVEKEMDKNAGQEESKVHVNRTVSKNPFEDPLEPETTRELQGQAEYEPMQNLVVEKEMDKNAGQEESKVHVNRTVSKNPFEDPLEPETTRELQGQAGTAPEMAPECEKPLHTPDTSTRVEYEPTQNLVVEKEMDKNAGQEESKVHVNRTVSKNPFEDPLEPETTRELQAQADETGSRKPTQETKKGTKQLKGRLSWRSKSVKTEVTANEKERQRKVPTTRENGGYSSTPPTTPPLSRKSPTSDMCDHCSMKSETKLPADRNKWPIYKIELGYLEDIYNHLDLDDRSRKPLLVALSCFSSNDAASIKKEFAPTGGKGMAKKALGMWATAHRTHNVGALKKVLSSMPRVDVLQVIENWEKLSVCHGCGIKLKKPQ